MQCVLDKELAALFGGETPFPDRVWVWQVGAAYGCYLLADQGLHGLACFSNAERAVAWRDATFTGKEGKAKEVSFDEAREIAKGRPHGLIKALLLLDDWDNPVIHWIA
jgi:hypothetical protein